MQKLAAAFLVGMLLVGSAQAYRAPNDTFNYGASDMLRHTEVSNFSSMGSGIKRADAVALSVRALTQP